MKILHFHTSIAQKTGGQTVMMSQIISVLKEMGHESTVVATDKKNEDSNLFNNIDIIKVDLDFETDDYNSVILDEIDNIITTKQIDIIFIHYVRNVKLLLKLSYISKNKSIPIIRRIADPNIVCFRNVRSSYFSGKQCDQKLGVACLLKGHFVKFNSNGKIRLVNIFSRLSEIEINKKFDAILVNSKYMYNLLVEHDFMKEKLHTIPNIIQFNEKIDTNNVDLMKETRTILFAGNIHKTKGIFYLLNSLEFIKHKVVLRIVGDGKHLKKAKEKAARIKTHEIIFINYVQHEEMLHFYKTSNVVVMPSLSPESFGLVGVEALYACKPIIALNVGGISDWMENNKTGYLLDRNTKSFVFAKYVDYLLSNPGIASEMGKYGRLVIEQKFQRYNWINNLERIFKTLRLI